MKLYEHQSLQSRFGYLQYDQRSKKYLLGEKGEDFTLKGGYRFKATGNVSSKACLISTEAKALDGGNYASEVYWKSKTVWKKPDGLLEFVAIDENHHSTWKTFHALIEKVSKEANSYIANFVSGMYPGVVVVQESNGNIVYSAKQPGVSITAAQVKAEIDRSVDFMHTREIRINMSGSLPIIEQDRLDSIAFQMFGECRRQYGENQESDTAFRERLINKWSAPKPTPLTSENLQKVLDEMEALTRKPIAKFHVDLREKKDI